MSRFQGLVLGFHGFLHKIAGKHISSAMPFSVFAHFRSEAPLNQQIKGAWGHVILLLRVFSQLFRPTSGRARRVFFLWRHFKPQTRPGTDPRVSDFYFRPDRPGQKNAELCS